MEVIVSKPAPVKRNKEEILSLPKECCKSKMSVKEFGKANGIHKATFYHWRNEYRD
jgi:transposase-like protein